MRCAWIVLVVVGCYEAPDYSGTHFKCDAEHACPDGQPCVDGVCGGSDSGGGSGSDLVDAPTSSIGVLCGATTCSSAEKCCADFVRGPICVSASAACAGFIATCDGTEDCGGSPCCDLGGQTIACGTTCSQQICRDDADCTGASGSTCCPSLGTGEPWGRCYPICP